MNDLVKCSVCGAEWEKPLRFCGSCGTQLGDKPFSASRYILPTGADEVLSVRDVHKTYLMGNQAVEALRGVNLGVKKGEMLAIMGPSGSGKSTLLHLLGGLDRPTRGVIRFLNQDLAVMSNKNLADYRLSHVGIIFQQFHLMPTLTVSENILMPMEFARITRNHQKERIKDLLDRVGLSERSDHLPSELSGGEQQRVAIARALANDPTIILADEPSGNLDSETGLMILATLRELNKAGRTVIMVTHDLKMAEFGDRIIKILDGKIIGEESLEAINK